MAQQGSGDRLSTPQPPRRLALALVLVLAGLCAVLAVVGPSESIPRASVHSPETAIPTPEESTAPPITSRPATPVAKRQPTTAAAKPAPLHVVALGDSVTDGTNCGCVPFPQLYSAGLADRYGGPVQIANYGVSGATSADLLTELTADEAVVKAADIVVVTIGANDFSDVSDQVLSASCGGSDDIACASSRLSQLRLNLHRIVTTIRPLHRAHPATVLLTGYWNVYEDGNVAEAEYSTAGRDASITLTREVNRVIEETAGDTGATYVDLFAPFKGADGDQDATPLLADDGDHPSAAGHRAIAQALLAAGGPAAGNVLAGVGAVGPAGRRDPAAAPCPHVPRERRGPPTTRRYCPR